MTSLLAVALFMTAGAPSVTADGAIEVEPPAASRTAGARPPAREPASAADAGVDWYGGPAIGADIAASVLMIAAADRNNTSMALFSLAVYGVGAPIAHAAHGNPGRMLGSLALRAGALATSYAILDETFSGACGGEDRGRLPSYCGWAVGLAFALPVVAAIVDDAVFARETRREGPPARVSLVPGFAVASGSALMSLGGRF